MTALFETMSQAAVLSYPRQRSMFSRLRERSAIVLKVLITDDRVASRKGLRALMLTQPDIQRIDREAAEEMEAAEQFAAESPYPNPDDISKMLYAQ